MNIDADELLGRLRRDYPMPYQLVSQQLIIDKQYQEIQQLKAEIAALRETAGKATGTAAVPADQPGFEQTRTFVRPPAPTPHNER